MERRERIIESALQVVADGGLKGLTHRAVDRHANLAEGSTGNLFPRRADLIHALLSHLGDRDKELFRQAEEVKVSAPHQVAALLARGVQRMVAADNAALTRVRLAMMPANPSEAGEFYRGFLRNLERTLTRAGADDVEARSRAVMDYLDGVVFHALTIDPRPIDLDMTEKVFLLLITQ